MCLNEFTSLKKILLVNNKSNNNKIKNVNKIGDIVKI